MSERCYIAIDGGGTGTRVGLYDEAGNKLSQTRGAFSNPHQAAPHAAAQELVSLATSLLQGKTTESVVVLAGISGARDCATRDIFAHALCANIPNAKQVIVTTDVHAHLLANANKQSSALVISGTGSSIAVLDANRSTHIFGGRGPILGDDGSAYDLAVIALRLGFAAKDREGATPALLHALTVAADLESIEDLIGWSTSARKHQIAELAETILHWANRDDLLAQDSLTYCAKRLARVMETAVSSSQLGLKAPIHFMGGMFEHSFIYRTYFQQELNKIGVHNETRIAPLIGHRAVFELSKQGRLVESIPHSEVTPLTLMKSESIDLKTSHDDDSAPLDTLNTVMLIERMQRADAFAASAVKSCSAPLALLINRVVRSFRHGGRLVYIGAGTSGRLGVLDASECPPTFGVPPEQVIGIMAGGDRALRDSVEGAEDDPDLGRADIEKISPPIGKDDVVVGIAASGTTPYTLGAIATAKALGASTAMVCCNPNTTAEVDYLLVLPTGTEVLPGSTRLKAGTATKMVLNTITTGAMALSGRVFEGYMIGVQPTNAKLRKRAAHIISVLTGINEDDAAHRLEEAGNDVAVAVMMERLKIPADNARELLNKTRGDVRAAIALHKNSG